MPLREDKDDETHASCARRRRADEPGVSLQLEDAKDGVSRQLNQVQNFIAQMVEIAKAVS